MRSYFSDLADVLRLVSVSFASYPLRSLTVIGAVFLTGLAESVGVLTLSPLISVVLG